VAFEVKVYHCTIQEQGSNNCSNHHRIYKAIYSSRETILLNCYMYVPCPLGCWGECAVFLDLPPAWGSSATEQNSSSKPDRTKPLSMEEQSLTDKRELVQQTEQTQFSRQNRTIAERAGINTGKQIEQGSI
jgi:hypothetical protein